MLEILLERGADIEAKDNTGKTPLWWAFHAGKDVAVKLLLEHGADVRTKGSDGIAWLSSAWMDV